jgi:SAM-dependent methyltransferase
MLTHTPARERFSLNDVNDKLLAIQNGLRDHATLTPHAKMQLSIEAEQLSQTELGRFLITNNGALSGWWTYYCILGYRQSPITNPVEKFLLEEAPTVLATRERFGHFQTVMREVIEKSCHETKPIKMASIPGGMAADLLTLEPTINLNRCQLQFINIDLDEAVFSLAQELAKALNCKIPLECRHEDAWKLSAREEFDLVASNGLNIYVSEREKVIALYASLLKTLKPGGTLVTSTLTPPPNRAKCEWNMRNIDQPALSRQAGIFAQILQATWSNFCTTDEMVERLTEAGFRNIKVIPDSRNMFPTFVGHKASL